MSCASQLAPVPLCLSAPPPLGQDNKRGLSNPYGMSGLISNKHVVAALALPRNDHSIHPIDCGLGDYRVSQIGGDMAPTRTHS
jgi:hypothetical protein